MTELKLSGVQWASNATIRRAGEEHKRWPVLRVYLGKRKYVTDIELSERDLVALIEDSAGILSVLLKEREEAS